MKRSMLALSLLAAPVAAFAYEPGHFYVIKSKINGHVLTAEGDAASQRYHVSPVAMRPATGAKNQLWYVERAPGWHGAAGLHYIRNYVGGRVLDVEGAQTNVITYPRIPTPQVNQLWLFNGARIQGLSANSQWKCLDVLYANWQYGPKVGTWACNGGANQDWTWERKDAIVAIGDVPGRVTTADTRTGAGSLLFARPLTPQEADRFGIAGVRSYETGYYKPFVLHERDVGANLCERLVVQGLANWRLPTKTEFTVFLNAWQPTAASKGGASLERLGWVNAQHWSSHERPAGSYVQHLQLWPDNLADETWVTRGEKVRQALVSCVR
ncbi:MULTISPECIES: RICIN domain-containing protein [Lysobacteraceae]|nr:MULTISPECIES: RICIN domain-containing protein [Lysobacter]